MKQTQNKTHPQKINCRPKNHQKLNKLTTFSIVFFACGFFVFVYVFFTNNNIQHTKRSPKTITTYKDFDTIKNNILKNKKLTNISENKITSTTHISNNIAYINNKYIAIIKRNKIFLVTAKNGSFITSLNISPISNDNEIYYYNIFTIDNNIIVTGYRKNAQVLEIIKLHLTKNLIIKRDAIYRLSSSYQNHDTLFIDNNLIFYTTHEITDEINQISSIEIWSKKENNFIPYTLSNQTILHDRVLSPTNPIIHTITSCPFKNLEINPQKCTQKQIIDNRDAIFNMGNKNILLMINNPPSLYSLTPTYSYTKKYHISPTNKDIYITTSQQNQQPPIISSKDILLSQQLSDDKEISIYKKDDEMLAKITYPQKNITTPFHFFTPNTLMSKYNTKISTLIQNTNLQTDKSHINTFNFKGTTFISIAFDNTKDTTGQLNLFKINSDNTIHNIYSLPIANYDTNVPNQFFTNTITSKLYALTNNYLRQFKYDTNNITLSRTINYTQKPVYKPKLKMADYPVGAKKENGKYVCKKKRKEYIGKSKQNNKGYYHLDRECCLDPDEYPNPWCTYRPGELSRTNLRYKDYTGKKVKR